MSPDRKSYLKIDEIQDLFLRHQYVKDKGTRVYDAFPQETENKTPADFKGTVPSWIEVSIHSTQVDSFLAGNQKLQLGDEADWLPEHFAKVEAAKDLYLPACEMLKQMDGIGYYNDNGKDIQEVLKSMASETTSQKSGTSNPLPFW